MDARSALVLSILIVVSFLISSDASPPPSSSQAAPPGALISVWFKSKVGVNLDSLPIKNGVRARAANYYLNQNVDFWKRKAALQTRMTLLRQILRRQFYPSKGQLTLPPFQRWVFEPSGPARRSTIDNHDYVSWDFNFVGILVTSARSVVTSEPSLAVIGGIWSDDWILPIEPEFVLQKSGYSCLDHLSFESGAVFSENAWFYYDDQRANCERILRSKIGAIKTEITWKRLPWNQTQANIWRYGEQTSPTADLVGVTENLKDHYFEYRYFPFDSCALSDVDPRLGSCIGAPGWRKLLKFTSSQKNIGRTDLFLGDVSNPAFVASNLFIYDPCHHHFHFQHYAEFKYRDTPGRKTGFCLQTTWRYHNNEFTDLSTPFDTCDYQGISVGWGDDYVAGLDCQWVDVTDTPPGPGNLSEIINPDDFICEGTPTTDEVGHILFEDTQYRTPTGKVVQREKCQFTKGYNKNNDDSLSVYLPAVSSSVTLPCASPLAGPYRNCGFKVLHHFLECKPGESVQSSIFLENVLSPVVLRLCESSWKLGKISTSCDFEGSIDTFIVNQKNSSILFRCPKPRDEFEHGGAFSVLVAPLLPFDQPLQTVSFFYSSL